MTTWWEGHLTLCVSFLHYKSPTCQVWWSQALRKKRYLVLSLSRDFTWLRCERVTWHYGWVSLIISDYPEKFSDHIPFGRGDVKLLIRHVTSRYHVLRDSYDIMGKQPSSYATTGPGFGAIRHAKEQIFWFSLVAWPHVGTWSMSYVTLWVGAAHPKSPSCMSYVSCCWKYIIYL